MSLRKLRHEDYTAGWVCALPIELAAAQEMLDEEHDDLERDESDENLYSLGSIKGHNVVIACLPAGRIGNNPAAAVATQMKAIFKGMRLGLMVGIGGGVPTAEADVHLGDVVVSQPYQTFGGVVQYDFGKSTPSGFERTGSLNAPPQILLSAVAKVRASDPRGRSKLEEHLSRLNSTSKFSRHSAGPDILYEATYDHTGGPTCASCDDDKLVHRVTREGDAVVVHYGTIASGNRVMKNGKERDTVSSELGGVLCFEMEAAGLMNNFPCLAIRGICDYGDSHKNKTWQPYAAGTAAAYTKEVLSMISPPDVNKARTVGDAMKDDHVRSSSYYLPFLRNHRFVGKTTELDEMMRRLFVDKDCRKMAIVGLGGIGKTQVALQFAHSVKETQPEYSIFWLPAPSLESFEQACVEIAKELRLAPKDKEDVKDVVKQYLSTGKAGKWLLVVDNADDADLLFGNSSSQSLIDYLPDTEGSLTVFTTRHQEVAQQLVQSDVLELEKMQEKEAISFLEKSLIKKGLLCDNAVTVGLLVELEYLPLAIAQAAAYINVTKISISEYLRLLKNTNEDIVYLMSQKFHDNTRYKDSKNAIATTWVVSFKQIELHDSDAADLLTFMSCIEWKAVPRSILPNVLPEARMTSAIGTICSYSFATKRDGQDVYDMHRLVHLATKIWMTENGRDETVLKRVVQHVAKIFPETYWTNRKTWREHMPHAICLASSTLTGEISEKYELSLKIGRCLYADGRYREAIVWLEDSCRWRERHLSEHDSRLLSSQRELAAAYSMNGQIEGAVKLSEHIITIDRKSSWDDTVPLASQRGLALAYLKYGLTKQAVNLLEHFVTIRKHSLPEDDHDLLSSQSMLGSAYLEEGKIEDAVQILQDAARIQEQTLEEDDPDRLISQHELARAYLKIGRIGEAIKLLEHVVTIEESSLIKDHPDALSSRGQLAEAYSANGRMEKAVEIREDIVKVQETLPEEHLQRLIDEHNLALAYYKNRQIEEAARLC